MMLNTNSVPKMRENKAWRAWSPRRGEIYLIDLGSESIDSEQRGLRPAIVVSNNICNRHSPVIQIVPLTSKSKTKLPVHVALGIKDGLKAESVACIEQVKCVSKRRAFLNNKFIKISQLSNLKMKEIDISIKIQFGLN